MNKEQYEKAQSICDYVCLDLETLIEEYEGNWDEFMSYLEDCEDMQDNLYRELEQGRF